MEQATMSLLDRAKAINDLSNKLCDENPGMTGTWWAIENASIEEMRSLQTDNTKMYFAQSHEQMHMQIHWLLPYPRTATIIAMSKKIAVKEHIVIEDAVINV